MVTVHVGQLLVAPAGLRSRCRARVTSRCGLPEPIRVPDGSASQGDARVKPKVPAELGYRQGAVSFPLSVNEGPPGAAGFLVEYMVRQRGPSSPFMRQV